MYAQSEKEDLIEFKVVCNVHHVTVEVGESLSMQPKWQTCSGYLHSVLRTLPNLSLVASWHRFRFELLFRGCQSPSPNYRRFPIAAMNAINFNDMISK